MGTWLSMAHDMDGSLEVVELEEKKELRSLVPHNLFKECAAGITDKLRCYLLCDNI